MTAIQPNTTSSQDAEAKEIAEYTSVYSTILGWSASLRASLLHRLIDDLARDAAPSKSRPNTLARARGLANNGKPAPSDEEVEQMLADRLKERYG